MAENGVVGLNPIRAKQQIDDLNVRLSSAQRTLVSDTQDYLDKLAKVWFSPNAKDISQSIGASIKEVDEEIKKNTVDIIEDSCRAFNSLAISQGIMEVNIVPGYFNNAEYTNCNEEDSSGNVGMKIKLVKEITDEYLIKLDKIKQNLQEIPKDISFYDNESEIASLFDSRVEKIKNSLNGSIDFVNKKITQAILEQEELVADGSSNATDILYKG